MINKINSKISKDDLIKEEPAFMKNLRLLVDQATEAAILCEAMSNNPHHHAIVHVNKKFCETFKFKQSNLYGKSYDSLFADVSSEHSREEQLEYIELIKAVKNFQLHSLNATLQLNDRRKSRERFNITFEPNEFSNEHAKRSIFTFRKAAPGGKVHNPISTKLDSYSAMNMERILRHERLLREVSNLIISDLNISEIAYQIAEILCQHLRSDRCLLHDYREGKTNFIVEYNEKGIKPLFSKDANSLKIVAKYINFQNNFYQRFCNKEKGDLLIVSNDVFEDENFLPIKSIYEKFAIASQIAATAVFSGKINGGIYLQQTSKRSWTVDEVDLVETIAKQFSIAIDRSNSIERVMIANHNLMEKAAQLRESLKHEKEMRKMQNEFVALVSHEFKTPLQIIDSTRELVNRKIKNHQIVDESLDKALERIKNGVERMTGLINGVLNLAKIESGEGAIKLEKEIFDLKKFVLEIIEKNNSLATNKSIHIRLRINELPIKFEGDPKLLDHCFTNVISNAIKYSYNDSLIKILAKTNNKNVAIRIIDKGIGIPKEDIENIGKKFFRAKNALSVAGTGIGLNLTKYFLEMHGGNLIIKSEINCGTSVTIVLPSNLSQ